MAEIPIILKLRKRAQKDVASAQDKIVEEIFKIFGKTAVLHGGTGIWRCYSGNRFSEDVDVYIPKNLNKLNLVFENLKKLGFIIEKKKIEENILHSSLKLDGTIVKFEAFFKEIKGELKEYKKIDGNIITIYTLIPEELIREKINAYQNRRKIRDLYDIFFLLRYTKNKGEVSDELKKFIKNFRSPTDEKEIHSLIIEGIVPDVEGMLNYIEREI
ncbi:nucleotidyl transferase AbiEii/AbiGii toxin family protein [Candidatus Woesearchaeota archaeon]|nr:nucleotidyl transferase AbiEii/AbiGii toxin family protein [Candidatus Woesearchaeota archaeon]